MRHRLGDRLRGDLVEDHAADRDARLELLQQVPGDRLALAVLISGEQELVRAVEQLPELRHLGLLVRVHDVQGLEVVVHVNPEPRPRLLPVLGRDLGRLVGHVPDVADAGLHHVVVAQVPSDRAGLRGRLDNDKPAPTVAVLPSGIPPAGCSPASAFPGGAPPSRRSLTGGRSLCWHASHLLAPVPLPSVCHAGPNSRVSASVFPTLMPPAMFPAGYDTPPGATRTCTGNIPATTARMPAPGNLPASAVTLGGWRPVAPRARKGHQCSSIPTVWSIFPAARHGTRPGGS